MTIREKEATVRSVSEAAPLASQCRDKSRREGKGPCSGPALNPISEMTLINRILRVFVEADGEELFHRVLEIVLEGLGSRHGVFGYIAEPGHLICPGLSKMLEKCEVAGKCIHYPPEKWKGLWARALKEKRPLYTNKPPPVPAGHVAIENNLAVPIRFRGEVIGLLNAANKEGGYTEADVRLLETMAERIAPLLEAWIQKRLRDEERRRAEETLRQSEEDFKRAQNVGNIGSWRLDVRNNKLLWSDQTYRIFGIPKGTVLTYELFLERVHPEDRTYVEGRWKSAMQGASFDVEHRIIADGRVKWVREEAYLEFDEEGGLTGGFGVAQDITERREAEAALRHLNEMLEERVARRTAEVEGQARQLRSLALQLSRAEQKERKRLASILHDHIQQLIVAARMQLGWIKGSGDLGMMRETVQEVSQILKEALDASRSLAVDLSPPVLQEAGLIAGLRWLASDMQKKSQFTVHVEADSRAEPVREEMRSLLFECVREMLLNSMKHAGVREARIMVLRTKDNLIRLIVSDQGRGFDPDLLKKRRSDEVSFGLFSCQERLVHLGGQMEIETAPGRGARIIMTVPILDPRPEEKVEKASRHKPFRPVHIRSKKGVCRVMIVDDHKIMRDGLSRLFQFESDIEVVGEASDGPRALKLAHRLRPDVIIMDVGLGPYSGIEVTRRIRKWDPNVRIIALSMHTAKDIADAMLRAGASAYLSKTGPSEELIDAVRAFARASTDR